MCPRAGYHWFECCTDDQKEISFNGRKPCMRPTAHDPGKAAGTLPVPWEGTGIAPYAGQAPRTVLLMQTEGCTLHNMLRNYGMACYTWLI